MRLLITATVTYEIDDVDSYEDAKDILRTAVETEAHYMEGVSCQRIVDVFASEVNDDGTLITNPRIWETAELW